MVWMCVTLTNDDIVAGKHAKLQDAFEAVFMSAVAPKNAALFENDDDRRNPRFYFSPGAVEIFRPMLAAWSATESSAPPRQGTKLLVGHDDARSML